MSFYRTYRPQVIDEIDNASVREHLLALLHKEKKDLPHAYLFTGPKGTGKTTAARVIAKLFNCDKPTKDGPCGKCEQCLAISKGSSLDVIEMDAASNRGIDEIRQLRDRIGLTPVASSYTVYIIDEVHMLTAEAFNALLKTLEEPPAHAVFVLATTDRQKVPSTIQSRCITISFAKASTDELTHALKRIAKAEKIHVTDTALIRIASLSDGSFRDAVKYLEQVSFSKDEITDLVVNKTLSVSDDKIRDTFLDHLLERDAKGALTDISLIVSDGRDIKSFLIDALSELERRLVEGALGVTTSAWDTASCQTCIALLTRAYGELKVSPVLQLPVELAVIEFCAKNNLPSTNITSSHESTPPAQTSAPEPVVPSLGLLTLEKLAEHWLDFIAATKPYNHSVAGVLRSSRPKAVEGGIVTIEAFYKFHQEKLNEMKTRQILADVLKKLFGEKVKVQVVVGKK